MCSSSDISSAPGNTNNEAELHNTFQATKKCSINIIYVFRLEPGVLETLIDKKPKPIQFNSAFLVEL